MSTEAYATESATDIVKAVLHELKDRGGFDHWWDDIEPETKAEIEQALVRVVKEQIEP